MFVSINICKIGLIYRNLYVVFRNKMFQECLVYSITSRRQLVGYIYNSHYRFIAVRYSIKKILQDYGKYFEYLLPKKTIPIIDRGGL
jgi:hypothetical protein